MSNTEKILAECGCDCGLRKFREVITEACSSLFPSWSHEKIVCHPEPREKVIAAVRKKLRCEDVPEFLINMTILNIHKYILEGDE